mmetsp:Transcript_13753/g.37640  ORF Transcript_13753/g.37640 Transcript_13753/m.37640 type:complete len:110 (-) Transcript_13753:231-560(-)
MRWPVRNVTSSAFPLSRVSSLPCADTGRHQKHHAVCAGLEPQVLSAFALDAGLDACVPVPSVVRSRVPGGAFLKSTDRLRCATLYWQVFQWVPCLSCRRDRGSTAASSS